MRNGGKTEMEMVAAAAGWKMMTDGDGSLEIAFFSFPVLFSPRRQDLCKLEGNRNFSQEPEAEKEENKVTLPFSALQFTFGYSNRQTNPPASQSNAFAFFVPTNKRGNPRAMFT